MCKPAKECIATTSANYFSGHGLGFSHDVGTSVSHACSVITDLSESFQNRASSPCRFMP